VHSLCSTLWFNRKHAASQGSTVDTLATFGISYNEISWEIWYCL
jgi:hypothetical protein